MEMILTRVQEVPEGTIDAQEDAHEEPQEGDGVGDPAVSVASRAALRLIWFYQRYLSPLTPPTCRFHPTCSQYTYEAIEHFGLWRGAWLGLCRICKCHPFHPGGYDPVPETLLKNEKTREQTRTQEDNKELTIS